MISKKLASFVIVVVTCAWAGNFIASLVLPGYEPDVAIHGVFMTVVGGTFALGRRDRGDGDDE